MINLFVSNLPEDVTEADLRAYFSQLGDVARVLLVRDAASGQPQGACFLDLERAASDVVHRLHGATYRGRQLDVQEAVKQAAPAEEAPTSEAELAPPLEAEAAVAEVDEHAATLRKVQSYIWGRYVTFQTPAEPIDEDEALDFLAQHSLKHPMEEDAECYYDGILAFERAYSVESPDRRRRLLHRAVRAFQAYRKHTSLDFSWDIVDDRYADALEMLDDLRQQSADPPA